MDSGVAPPLLWGCPHTLILITILLLRNSEIHLISWLDLSEEYIGETLGFVQLSLPRADPLLPPQLVGAIYSRYVFGAEGGSRTQLGHD